MYITYVRFDRGNNIYLQRLTVSEGVITPQDDTLVHVLSPQEDYEADEYGRIVEGGVIIPHGGWYYMIYADGHYLGSPTLWPIMYSALTGAMGTIPSCTIIFRRMAWETAS